MFKKFCTGILVLLILFSFSSNSSALSLIGNVNVIWNTPSSLTGRAYYNFRLSDPKLDGTNVMDVVAFNLNFDSSTFVSFASVGGYLFPYITEASNVINLTPGNFPVLTPPFYRFTLEVDIELAGPDQLISQSFGFTGVTRLPGALAFPGTLSPIISSSNNLSNVPEPASLFLLGAGLFGFGLMKKFRKK